MHQATDRRFIDVPKAVLHDHLDGGPRPATILEIAEEIGHPLPAESPDDLDRWFVDAASSGTLVRYLATFEHTVAVMQRAADLRRIAQECVADLAADGVVYAEVRYAPEQHLMAGLGLDEVVEAVQAGFEAGADAAHERGREIVVRQILTALRHAAMSREIAELAVRHRDRGVCGFDIAGAEAGYPPTRHLDAFEYLQRQNAHFTIHAGEAFGLPSIWQALQWCGAERLGHGVRIADDIDAGGDEPRLGRLAGYVRDRRIPLEMCPTSNVQTGAAASMLAVLGLGNLPGAIALTPLVVMLLAAPGSSHRHDGRLDWLVPAVLQAGQYIYIAALGFASGVPGPVIFALCAMIAIRSADLAYQAENGQPQAAATAGAGMGWEGRMLAAGLGAILGIATFAYLALAAYLGALICRKILASCLMPAREDRW